jgi:hypothetical protein
LNKQTDLGATIDCRFTGRRAGFARRDEEKEEETEADARVRIVPSVSISWHEEVISGYFK